MAVVVTSSTRSAARLLLYTVTPKAGATADRVEFISGLGCRPMTAAREFAMIRRIYGKEGGIQARHIIQSFGPDEFSPDDDEAGEEVHTLGRLFAKQAFPGCQVQIVTQRDGKSGLWHNHIVVNAVVRERMVVDGQTWEPGRKVAGNLTHIDRLRRVSDEVLASRGHEQPLPAVDAPVPSRTNVRDWRSRKSGGPESNHDRIRRTLREGVEHPGVASVDDLMAYLDVEGIDRPNERRWSFVVRDTGQTKPVRGKTLGDDFTQDYVTEQLAAKAAGRDVTWRSGHKVSAPAKPVRVVTPAELVEARRVVERLAAQERARRGDQDEVEVETPRPIQTPVRPAPKATPKAPVVAEVTEDALDDDELDFEQMLARSDPTMYDVAVLDDLVGSGSGDALARLRKAREEADAATQAPRPPQQAPEPSEQVPATPEVTVEPVAAAPEPEPEVVEQAPSMQAPSMPPRRLGAPERAVERVGSERARRVREEWATKQRRRAREREQGEREL